MRSGLVPGGRLPRRTLGRCRCLYGVVGCAGCVDCAGCTDVVGLGEGSGAAFRVLLLDGARLVVKDRLPDDEYDCLGAGLSQVVMTRIASWLTSRPFS